MPIAMTKCFQNFDLIAAMRRKVQKCEATCQKAGKPPYSQNENVRPLLIESGLWFFVFFVFGRSQRYKSRFKNLSVFQKLTTVLNHLVLAIHRK